VSTSKNVIVADDTAFVRDRFATALLSAGHTAHGVKSAAELLARLRSDLDRLDLIVLDLRLPWWRGTRARHPQARSGTRADPHFQRHNCDG
jgi:CheY-like chemotaxis protein